MRYPMLNNWLVFSRKNQYEYDVHDCLYDEDFTMGVTIAAFARKLDGHRNPYSINMGLTKAEINHMLKQLREHDLLRYGRSLDAGSGAHYTLWFIKRNPLLMEVARLWNCLLMLSWLPVFIFGVLFFIRDLPIINTDCMWLGNILGIVFGALLHELGHAFAGLTYGARVFEIGIMINALLPGAYVLMDSQSVQSKMKRIQIYAAGVESNALFAGVCLLIACAIPYAGAFLLNAAIGNIILALVNITFGGGLDGASILSELLGIENLVEDTKKVVLNRRIRRKLRSKGMPGYALIAVSVVVQILQITIPVIIGWNIVEAITCFV